MGKSRVEELPDGSLARIEVSKHLDYAASVDVHVDGWHYQYGVTAEAELERVRVFDEDGRVNGADEFEYIDEVREALDLPRVVA